MLRVICSVVGKNIGILHRGFSVMVESDSDYLLQAVGAKKMQPNTRTTIFKHKPTRL